MKKPSKQALLNYFKGNSVVDEQEAIEAYLAMEIDTAYVEQCLKEAMADTDADVLSISLEQHDQAWKNFDNHRLGPVIGSIPKPNRKWMAYAASVTIFIASATLALYFSQSLRIIQSAVVYHRMKASYGKINHITLPDSSHLALFPGTIIDIPSDFNAVNRKVFLNGRAYFEVAHNKQKPFYVLASKVATRVLGTSFEVNATREAKAISVLLRTGRVAVSDKSKELAILRPGQKLTFHPATGTFIKEQVQADHLLTWVNGELAFNQTNFAEICNELEKWYHITIKVKDQQLLKKKITAGFKDQSATQVLDILSVTAGFKYKLEKNTIQIY